MNEFIGNMLKFLSIESLMEKGWLELMQITMPLFLLFLVFFGLSFYIQHKRWKAVASVICALVVFVYLPYEFYRQSMVSARRMPMSVRFRGICRNFWILPVWRMPKASWIKKRPQAYWMK